MSQGLIAWVRLMFDNAKERWPDLTEEQFKAAMDRVLDQHENPSIEEMSTFLVVELEQLFPKS